MPRRDPLATQPPTSGKVKSKKKAVRPAVPESKPAGSRNAAKPRKPTAPSRTRASEIKHTADEYKLLLHGPARDSSPALNPSEIKKTAAPVLPPPEAATSRGTAGRRSEPSPESWIPRERMFAYQLGYLSLMAKALFAILFGLLAVLELPYGGLPAGGVSSAIPNTAASPDPTPTAIAGAGTVLPTLQTVLPTAVYYDPAGCLEPEGDYDITIVNGHKVNRRTLSMLRHAAELYHGSIDIQNSAISKGGYHVPQGQYATPSPGDLSLGTHNGGGSVDLSIVDPRTNGLLFFEVEPLIRALRAAGFAAWYRDETDGLPPHIHAIAIGDQDLSPEAEQQLTGPEGYFRGLNGLSGARTNTDKHGGPVVCEWMIAAGFSDLRPVAVIAKDAAPHNTWREDLRAAAASYITQSPDETAALARRIGWIGTGHEDASNMCGPLAAAILRDAGMLPVQAWPNNYLKESFWLASPRVSGRPWIFFPQDIYQVTTQKTPINLFNFEAEPLCPGDFLYTYTEPTKGGYEHMFVVTEVDEKGRAWTVTNEIVLPEGISTPDSPSQVFVVERVLLYDPGNPAIGAFRKDWVTDVRHGLTGLGGFDVQRHAGFCMDAGNRVAYNIRPGDTLPKIAARFFSTVTAIAQANGLSDLAHLIPGQILQIPVNLTLKDASSGQTTGK